MILNFVLADHLHVVTLAEPATIRRWKR